MFAADAHDLLYISLKEIFKQALPTMFAADVPIFSYEKPVFMHLDWWHFWKGTGRSGNLWNALSWWVWEKVLWLNQLSHLKSFPWLEITISAELLGNVLPLVHAHFFWKRQAEKCQKVPLLIWIYRILQTNIYMQTTYISKTSNHMKVN